MPQFAKHLPSTKKAMNEARSKYNMAKSLPIGIIGENNNFAYGWDGCKYYVTEGILQYLVTRMHLVFDEAKQLFNALSFNNASEPCVSQINYAIKEARKLHLSGDNLFWFLTDKI